MSPHPEATRALARAVAVASDPTASTRDVDLALAELAHAYEVERAELVAGIRLSRLDALLWRPTIGAAA